MEELRRFHFGDPAAASSAPAPETLPEAFAPLAGRSVENPWPLWIDAGATEGSWLRPATPEERANPGSTGLVPCDRRAPLAMLSAAARRRFRLAHDAYASEARTLAETAEALLAADRARRPKDASAPADRALGSLGERFVDATALARVVAHRRSGPALPEPRRQRLEAARDRLAAFASAGDGALWIVPPGVATGELGASSRVATGVCDAAAEAFDEASAGAVALGRAARLVRLEAAHAFQPERHELWLDRLDWRSLSAAELLLVRPVLALLPDAESFAAELPALSRLLLSGRPVQVLLLTGPGAPATERLDPVLLGLAHREAFVQQGSLALPLELAFGFGRALASRRPALHMVDAPPVEGSGVDPWLVASARVAGRATPLLRFDPESGETWARRLHVGDNPAPRADWAPLPAATEGEESQPLTFADAALLDPAWRGHFARVADASEELVALAAWLALAEPENVRRLPTVRALDGSREVATFVVSRTLAETTRDRLASWRTLEELAGVRSAIVDAAAEKARTEAEAAAQQARQELLSRQEAEIAAARAEADEKVVTRLVAALLELGSGGTAMPALAPMASAPATTAAVSEAAAATAVAPSAPAGEAAWLDTALCTSCDECVRKFPAIFVYNANKQAVIKNARGGSFRDLVVAAESCTAKIIHPGTPWNADEPDLARSLERARPFA